MKAENPMKQAASSDFFCQALAISRNIQQRKFRLSPFEQHGVPFTFVVAESDIFPINVPVARLQLSDQRAFWVSSRSPKAGMDRHCRRVWQVADCHAQTCGTWRRTSASLSAEARPPAASSWCVPNTFPPAAPDAPSPHMGGAFPSASPQNISCSAQPSRKVAVGRLPPARPSPSDGCPVRTRSRPP